MTTSSTPTPTAVPGKVSDRTAMPQRTGARKRRGTGRGEAGWLVRIVVLLLCLMWIVPTIGLLVTSLRTQEAADRSGWWTVLANPFTMSQWTVQNYTEVLREGMGDAFINSLVVTVPATVIPILIAAFAAYAFTFMHFPGRDVVFAIVVGLLVVPVQVAFVPLLQLFGQLGLNGQFLALWLAHAGFGMPLAIYILRNYMSTLPRGIIESAKIDGASHFSTFWRLIIPMSVPALASFAIFQFLWVWNDLLVALVFLGGGQRQVVTQELAGLVGAQNQGWQLITAGAFVSMIVPLVVFISLQRYFIRGLTAGSIKG